MAQEFQREIYESQHSGYLIEDLAGSLLKSSPNVDPIRPLGWVADSQWIRQSFIVDTDSARSSMLDEIDRSNRSFSSASMKFTDTSLGGNTVVNPPPAFTRYADPPTEGIVQGVHSDYSLGPASDSIGMGAYYSEAIDDNSQVIHLRFGVAQFNSMTQFFTGFYSSRLGNAARAGRFGDSFVDDFLRTAGKVLSMALAPLAILPAAILMAGSAVRFFFNWPTSKFYTLRPAMPMYWNAVTSMVNQLAANMGIVTYMEDKQIESVIGKQQSLRNEDANGQSKMSVLNRLSNGMINEYGAIDVIQIVNRAKRLEMNYDHQRMKMLDQAGPNDTFAGIVQRTYAAGNNLGSLPYSPKGNTLEALFTRYLDKLSDLTRDKEDGKQVEMDPKKTSGENGDGYQAPQDSNDKWYDYFFAELGDGSDWASFRVDYTGPVSESFTNSTAESSLAQKINGLTSSAHDVRMNYSGVTGSIPGLDTVLDGVKTVLRTVASTLHLEGLAAFAGSSFVDIPHHWESSVAQLPKASYTINLVSPYGNPVSRMFNIYLPLCMLLAGALPLSTGKQSFTSPFLCQIHDRGRLFSRLAIIDSISITRGTGNLGFNNEGQPMAVEVQITFKDLTSIMSLPIQGSFWDQPLAGIFDSENAFSDYLMALSSMTLGDMTYRVPMLKHQIKRKMAEFSAFTSKASIMNAIAGWPGVNALSGIMKGTSKK